MGEKCCFTCKNYIGGGYCRINEEMKCSDSEFELWKEKKNG